MGLIEILAAGSAWPDRRPAPAGPASGAAPGPGVAPNAPSRAEHPRAAHRGTDALSTVEMASSATARPGSGRIPLPRERPSRIQIEDPQPVVDGGARRAKACEGDAVEVSATIFIDGHDELRASVRHRRAGERRWRTAELARVDPALGVDRWAGRFEVDAVGRWQWQIEAHVDRFATWRGELERKLGAGETELGPELSEGAAILAGAQEHARGADAALLERATAALGDEATAIAVRCRAALDPALAAAASRHPQGAPHERSAVVELDVERRLARTGCWYELFPRSWGGFDGVRERLPRFAALGVDVLYLPPIHPIGETARKGRNDAPAAAPGDPGSPWAIGGRDGGHTAVHRDLGTIADFDGLVGAAREHGIEIALDFAVQCSADHPWLTEHPEWFRRRPDGTLKYAENPPKRYRDIYNVDFECEDWRRLWRALRDVVLFWVGHGVRVFRVDNPHTKPLPFWEWLIESVRAVDPGVIFLSEAFTREPMMLALAKAGFSQSYTYFTWKNTSWELREYLTHLAEPEIARYLRPNLFVNTPDILTEYLQRSGPAGFASRLVLAATLGPSYGVYSGFERYEATPREPGSEEYRDSEKYQLRERELDGPLLPLLARLNEIRRAHPALQHADGLRFLETENEQLLGYARRRGEDLLLVVATLDPRRPQEGLLVVAPELGLPASFAVHDLLGGERFDWHRGPNYVRLDPAREVAHVLHVEVPGP
jgi:starch synthase (maltosyl-transferring)